MHTKSTTTSAVTPDAVGSSEGKFRRNCLGTDSRRLHTQQRHDSMTKRDYFKPEIVSLQRHTDLNERWIQDRITEDPRILGLGDLVVKDEERIQPGAGRLDLLLQDSDPESLQRYEVEIQLGDTDPSHIIRTIEYWDIERRRYPRYEHCAVIVAEKITGRFFNVISLFNGFIPLVAIQLQAVTVGDKIGLLFTKILDERHLGIFEKEDDGKDETDRAYWENKGSKKTVELADQMVEMVQTFAPGYELNFTKHYIGLAINGQANNFVEFRPQKKALRFHLRLPEAEDMSRRLDACDIEVFGYDRRWAYYKIRLSSEDLSAHRDDLVQLMKEAYKARGQ